MCVKAEEWFRRPVKDDLYWVVVPVANPDPLVGTSLQRRNQSSLCWAVSSFSVYSECLGSKLCPKISCFKVWVYICSLLRGIFLVGSVNQAMMSCFVHLVYWFAGVLLHYPQFLPKWSTKSVFKPTNHHLVLSTSYLKFVCYMNSRNDWQTNLNFVYNFIMVHFVYCIVSWVLSRGWSLIEMDTLCVWEFHEMSSALFWDFCSVDGSFVTASVV